MDIGSEQILISGLEKYRLCSTSTETAVPCSNGRKRRNSSAVNIRDGAMVIAQIAQTTMGTDMDAGTMATIIRTGASSVAMTTAVAGDSRTYFDDRKLRRMYQ